MSHSSDQKKINIEFWIGNIFTLIATVVGVYLAANSGFQKAIEFESLQQKRDTYYVQSALYSELNTNLEAIRIWTKEFDKSPRRNDMHLEKDKYQFNFFLWETMQEGSEIFQVPYPQLKRIALFYDRAKHLREIMLSGNPFAAPKASKDIAELENEMRANFIGPFLEDIQTLKHVITEKGMAI